MIKLFIYPSRLIQFVIVMICMFVCTIVSIAFEGETRIKWKSLNQIFSDLIEKEK